MRIRASNITVRRHQRGAILEYEIVVVQTDGSTSRMPAVSVLTVEADQLTRIEEYFIEQPGHQ
jgi:hypothetical protein